MKLNAAWITVICFSTCCAQVATPQIAALNEARVASVVRKRVEPIYPASAKDQGIRGPVLLRVWVSKTGDLRDVKALIGHPLLTPSALDAVRQWKFAPFLLNDRPLEFQGNVRVNVGPTDPQHKDDIGDFPPGSHVNMGFMCAILEFDPKRSCVDAHSIQKSLIRKITPVYPSQARKQHIEGEAYLRVEIDPHGSMRDVRAICGDPLLLTAATNAVKQWKYRLPPALRKKPLVSIFQINFKLPNTVISNPH